MLLKRTLTTLVCLLAIPLALQAQQTATGGLSVRSFPDGAEVSLQGDALVSGITPTLFQQNLVGRYHVVIKRHGYETFTTNITLDPSKLENIDVKLSPKTRVKAAARSLFIPGWGQSYGGQRTKGTLLTILAAGSVGAFLVSDHDFQKKNDRFKASILSFDSSVAAGASRQDLQTLQQSLASNQKRAYDAENVRRATIGVAIGVWSLGVLDALLFFPEDRSVISVKGVSVAPTTASGGFGLVLTKRF
jgi:hypothetical protein